MLSSGYFHLITILYGFKWQIIHSKNYSFNQPFLTQFTHSWLVSPLNMFVNNNNCKHYHSTRIIFKQIHLIHKWDPNKVLPLQVRKIRFYTSILRLKIYVDVTVFSLNIDIHITLNYTVFFKQPFVCFGLILRHINYRRLSNAKSFYTYMLNIWFLNTFYR